MPTKKEYYDARRFYTVREQSLPDAYLYLLMHALLPPVSLIRSSAVHRCEGEFAAARLTLSDAELSLGSLEILSRTPERTGSRNIASQSCNCAPALSLFLHDSVGFSEYKERYTFRLEETLDRLLFFTLRRCVCKRIFMHEYNYKCAKRRTITAELSRYYTCLHYKNF